MIILGIDPGLESIGYGAIEVSGKDYSIKENGVIKTDKHKYMASRLAEIYQDIIEIVTQVKPDVISIEKLFFFKNVSSGIQVAQARGVILAAIETVSKAEIVEYTPGQMKKQVCGDGVASKDMVKKVVKKLLGKEVKDDNNADALGLALCHAMRI